MPNKLLNTAFDFLKDSIWKCTHKDAAKMLIGMGALGFALSSAAQCFAIKTNDKIDDKKKKFMLTQEAADGVVNIGLFLAVTHGVWAYSDKILRGLLGLKDNGAVAVTGARKKSYLKSGGRIVTTMIGSIVACNIITPFVRNFIAGKLRKHFDTNDYNSLAFLGGLTRNQNQSPFNNFDKLAFQKFEKLPAYNLSKNYSSGLRI